MKQTVSRELSLGFSHFEKDREMNCISVGIPAPYSRNRGRYITPVQMAFVNFMLKELVA